MNHNLTDITVVLDESGSMGVVRNDTIGGLNTYVSEQKKLPGEANLTIWKFAHTSSKLLPVTALKSVLPFTQKDYNPVGGTALRDAIATAINDTGSRLRNTPETQRPGKVLFVVMTDGEENQSKYTSVGELNAMIQRQTKDYSWEFIYLGANHDSFAQAQTLGFMASHISHNDSYQFGGMEQAIKTANLCSSNYRSGGNAAVINGFVVKEKV